MLQDSWRFSFFALGRGNQAFLNDVVWAVVLAPTMLILRLVGHMNVFYAVLAWGGSATVAAAVGPLQARALPKLSHALSWLSETRDLGPRYMAEGIASPLATQLRSYGLGFMLGLASVGYVQASVTLIGPVTIMFLGMSLVLYRRAHESCAAPHSICCCSASSLALDSPRPGSPRESSCWQRCQKVSGLAAWSHLAAAYPLMLPR